MRKTFRKKFRDADAIDQVMMVTFIVLSIFAGVMTIAVIFKICGAI